MCIAISKTAKAVLSKELLTIAYDQNSDGAGLAFVQNGQLVVKKGFMTLDAFLKAYEKYKDCGDMLIHCRVASVGMKVCAAQCHPFQWDTLGSWDIQEKEDYKGKPRARFQFAAIHNGRLSYRSTAKQSDTSCFVEDVLEPLLGRDPSFLDGPAGYFLLEQYLGEKNKLLIMRYDAQYNKIKTYILNKKLGHEAHGCWFSNYSYIRVIRQPWEDDYGYSMGGRGGYYGRGEMMGEHQHHGAYRPTGTGQDENHPDAEGWYWKSRVGEVPGCYVHKPTGITAADFQERNVKQAEFSAIARRLRAKEDAQKLAQSILEDKAAERREMASQGSEASAEEGIGGATESPKNDDPPYLLLHLKEADRQRYRTTALFWARVAIQTNDISINDAIEMLRDEVKALMPHLGTYQELDNWVLERTKVIRHGGIMEELEKIALAQKIAKDEAALRSIKGPSNGSLPSNGVKSPAFVPTPAPNKVMV